MLAAIAATQPPTELPFRRPSWSSGSFTTKSHALEKYSQAKFYDARIGRVVMAPKLEEVRVLPGPSRFA